MINVDICEEKWEALKLSEKKRDSIERGTIDDDD